MVFKLVANPQRGWQGRFFQSRESKVFRTLQFGNLEAPIIEDETNSTQGCLPSQCIAAQFLYRADNQVHNACDVAASPDRVRDPRFGIDDQPRVSVVPG
jgi:hypothetical protein